MQRLTQFCARTSETLRRVGSGWFQASKQTTKKIDQSLEKPRSLIRQLLLVPPRVTLIPIFGVALEVVRDLISIPSENEKKLALYHLTHLNNGRIVTGLNKISESVSRSAFAARPYGEVTEILVQVVAHLDSPVEYVRSAAVSATKHLSTHRDNVNDLRNIGAANVLMEIATTTGDENAVEALANLCRWTDSDADYSTCVMSQCSLIGVIPLIQKTTNPLEVRNILKIIAAITLQYEHLSNEMKNEIGQHKELFSSLTESEDDVLSGYAAVINNRISGYTTAAESLQVIDNLEAMEGNVAAVFKVTATILFGFLWGAGRAYYASYPIIKTGIASAIGGSTIVSLDQYVMARSVMQAREVKTKKEMFYAIGEKSFLQCMIYVTFLSLFPFSLIPSTLPKREGIAVTLSTAFTSGVEV